MIVRNPTRPHTDQLNVEAPALIEAAHNRRLPLIAAPWYASPHTPRAALHLTLILTGGPGPRVRWL